MSGNSDYADDPYDDEIDNEMSSEHSHAYDGSDDDDNDSIEDQLREIGMLAQRHASQAQAQAQAQSRAPGHAGGFHASGNGNGNRPGADIGMGVPEDATMIHLLRTLQAAQGVRMGHLEGLGTSRIQSIIRQLQDWTNQDGVMIALENLSEILLSAREETMLLFPVHSVADELVNLLSQRHGTPEIYIMAARSITQLIESGLPNVVTVLVELDIIDTLQALFAEMEYIDVAEQAINILERVATEYPGLVLEGGAPVPLLQFIDFFNQHIQKTILTVVGHCCTAINPSNMEQAKLMIPILENHMDGDNEKLNDMAIGGMCQIIRALSKRSASPAAELGSTISVNIRNILISKISPDTPLLAKLFRALSELAYALPEFARELVEKHVAENISFALTKIDVTSPGTYDQNSVVSTLLHRPKDTLFLAIRLLGVMLPLPPSRFAFHGPYRRHNNQSSHSSPDLQRIPDAVLEKLAIVAGQTAVLVYTSSADLATRQIVLLLVLQLLTSLPAALLEKFVPAIDLVSFACNVVSQADSKSLTVGGLEITYELITKVPASIQEFASRGMHLEVAGLVGPDPAPEPKGTFSMDSDLKPVEAFLASQIRNVHNKSYAGSEKDSSRAVEVTEKFRNPATRDWNEVAALIKESSTLEMLQLGLFGLVADALAEGDVTGYLAAVDSDLLTLLVSKLQDALSRSEHFGMLSSYSNSVPSLFHALTRQVHLKLKERNSSRSWPVTVHGIAAIENLEKFCISRLNFAQLFSHDNNGFGALGHDSGDSGSDASDDNSSTQHSDDRFSFEGDNQDQHGHDLGEHNHRHHHQTEDGHHHTHGHAPQNQDLAMHSSSQLSVQGNSSDAESGEDALFEDAPDNRDGLDAPGEAPAGDLPVGHGDAAESPEGSEDLAAVASDGSAELVAVEDQEEDLADTLGGRTLANSAAEMFGDAAPAIKFYFGDTLLDSDMSVIGAIYKSFAAVPGDSTLPRSLWSDEFTITFERSRDPAPKRRDLKYETGLDTFKSVPESFGESHHLSGTIRLLSILYALHNGSNLVNPSIFINSKLTAKLNRQLEDPLVVVSSILPQWVPDSVRLYPFLYPFESRYLFVQSTSFGYSRSMARWQQSDDGAGGPSAGHQFSFGRTVKQKYRVSRTNLLSSAMKVMQMSSGLPSMIEIEYYGEEGTGVGPTLEFYAHVSRDFQRSSMRMWRESEVIDGYAFARNGLFPAPMKSKDKDVLRRFTGMGMFMARAMLDQRIIDFRLNPAFFTIALDLPRDDWLLLEKVDPDLFRILEQMDVTNIDSMDLDFTLPGSDIEMIHNGHQVKVSAENLTYYIEQVMDWTLSRGVKAQIEAFKKGFSKTMPFEALHAFTANELSMIAGQSQEDWGEATLRDTLRADHGYTMNSQPVLDMINIMSTLDEHQRRSFLQFMTGSPNLPLGGFKALSPPFTIVFKHPDTESIDKNTYLPSVMTCANYLKLPDYSSKDIMRQQLWKAIEGGSGAFPLS